MEVLTKVTLRSVIEPVIALVTDKNLQNALQEALNENETSIEAVEDFFDAVPQNNLDNSKLSFVFNSWKATHLKMLAIYGLSCRLQRMASQTEGETKLKLLVAGSLNAETSYEDLGLDFDAETHADLYNQFAAGFLPDDNWVLQRYTVQEAADFKNWVYRNMVVGDIQTGLFTNMFSEIYNHGEYSVAREAFAEYLDKYSKHSPEKKKAILTYIEAHIEDDTEKEHFLVVVKALNNYAEATNTAIDYALGKRIFSEYLQRLSKAMQAIKKQIV
jgi:hypothetical protein